MATQDNGVATKKCRFCQTEIDAKATICPSCRKEQKKKAPVWLIILIVIIALCSLSSIATSGNKGKNIDTSSGNTTTEAPKKFNIDEIYEKIKTGMTEAQVKAIITKDPINCTESEIQGLGTAKLCTYGNVFLDSGAIMVTYNNGKVMSKTKSQY